MLEYYNYIERVVEAPVKSLVFLFVYGVMLSIVSNISQSKDRKSQIWSYLLSSTTIVCATSVTCVILILYAVDCKDLYDPLIILLKISVGIALVYYIHNKSQSWYYRYLSNKRTQNGYIRIRSFLNTLSVLACIITITMYLIFWYKQVLILLDICS
jgi:O-antigen/teichoic acid export membrane protein